MDNIDLNSIYSNELLEIYTMIEQFIKYLEKEKTNTQVGVVK